MASNYEKVLAAEWLVVMGVETADAFGNSRGDRLVLPSPSRYFATMVVFLALAGVAMFGESPAKLAAAFGGVAGLTILLTPVGGASLAPGAKNAPLKPGAKVGQAPVIGALKYISGLMSSGSRGAPHTTATVTGRTTVQPAPAIQTA